MRPEILHALRASATARRPVVLATRLSDGLQALLGEATAIGEMPPAEVTAAAAEALEAETSSTIEASDGRWFLHVHPAPFRLAVVGAVHIAQALVPMAQAVGLAVTVIDPRGAFATPDRFPGVTLSNDWPDDAMKAWNPDARSAVVTLTHDPKLDDPALDAALRSPARYIGALGSRKTHASRLQRLAALGHSPEALARIHGPAGLDIGAMTAPEIALSILAQLVAVRRGGAQGSVAQAA